MCIVQSCLRCLLVLCLVWMASPQLEEATVGGGIHSARASGTHMQHAPSPDWMQEYHPRRRYDWSGGLPRPAFGHDKRYRAIYQLPDYDWNGKAPAASANGEQIASGGAEPHMQGATMEAVKIGSVPQPAWGIMRKAYTDPFEMANVMVAGPISPTEAWACDPSNDVQTLAIQL